MTVETAYDFLQASLDQFNEDEKVQLCELILGRSLEAGKKKKKKPAYDPIMSKVEMKKRLMKSHFKSRIY